MRIALGTASAVVAWWIIGFAACSDGAPAATTAPPDAARPSTGDAGGADANSGVPNETIDCPSVEANASCKVPADLDGVALGTAWATTDPKCNTRLYVSKQGTSSLTLARYTLKSTAPCELVVDSTFTAGEPGEVIAADEAGKVYTLKGNTVARIAPMPAAACTSELGAAFLPYALAVTRDGSAGFVAYAESARDPGASKLAKIVPSATGCSLAPLTLGGSNKLLGMEGIAIDTKGRLHVAGHGSDGDRVVIYEADGSFVATYTTGAKINETLQSVRGITPCKGGVCVEDSGYVVAVDENGVFRFDSEYAPAEATSFHLFVGTVRGPLFGVAGVNGAKKILVDIVKDR